MLQLVVHDYDQNGNASIVFGPIQFPQDGSGFDLFVIDSSTGAITTNVGAEAFNRTATPRYKAAVYVMDSGGHRSKSHGNARAVSLMATPGLIELIGARRL